MSTLQISVAGDKTITINKKKINMSTRHRYPQEREPRDTSYSKT
ncbi:hypothetical protein [Fodinibius sp. AD559]